MPVGRYRGAKVGKDGTPLLAGNFPEVAVLSMSTYLRLILTGGHATIALDLPIVAERRQWLDRIFPR